MICTLSLFSGIGGIDLGLERTGGFQVVGQCELDPFCREVLAKHWPNVWRHDDIATLTAGLIRERCGQIDCICGGFPCQDVSAAGKGAGIVAGERSGLWWQMFRIIATVRPRWIIAENVPALRTRGADDIIAVLEGIGYACWPLVVGAWAVGAPHKRDRVWIVAHSARHDQRRQPEISRADGLRTGAASDTVEHSNSLGRSHEGNHNGRFSDGAGAGMADAEQCKGVQRRDADLQRRQEGEAEQTWLGGGVAWPARPGEQQHDWEEPRLAYAASVGQREQTDEANTIAACGQARDESGDGSAMAHAAGKSRGSAGQSREGADPRSAECAMGSSASRLSERLVRFGNRNALKAYGNAVVPQVVTAIGNAILRAESDQ